MQGFDLSKLTAKQIVGLKILNDDNATRIQFEGGSRSGKTFLICVWIILRALAYPGSQHIIARFARVKAKATVWRQTLLPLAKMLERFGWAKINYSDLRIDFRNNSYIIVDGLEPARIEGVLGSEWATIFVNECNENKWATIELLFSRLTQVVRRAKDGKLIVPKLLTDLNPTTKTSWHFRLFHLKQDPVTGEPRADAANIFRLHFEPKDNIENQSPGYIKNLESGSESFRRRFLLGLYGSFEGLVYPEFNEDIHIVDDYAIPKGTRRGNLVLGRAIDFGFWPDPFVCLWMCYDIKAGTVTVYREWYQHRMIVREHARNIYELSALDLPKGSELEVPDDTDEFYAGLKKGKYRQIEEQYDFTVCDHDSEDRETLLGAQIANQGADKRRLVGFEHVTEMLGYSEHKRPMLRIDRRCTNTINEFESYRWATDAGDERKKKDRATSVGDDHAMDALRYGMMRIIPPAKEDFDPVLGRIY